MRIQFCTQFGHATVSFSEIPPASVRDVLKGTRGDYHIVHRDGYGIRFCRVWNDSGRLCVSPLRRYRRDEPPAGEITMSASRTFGALANDIRNRMINDGLQVADEKDRASERVGQGESRKRFGEINNIILAWNGKMRESRYWKTGTPIAEVPGGLATVHYDGNGIDLELSLPTAIAVELGRTPRVVQHVQQRAMVFVEQ